MDEMSYVAERAYAELASSSSRLVCRRGDIVHEENHDPCAPRFSSHNYLVLDVPTPVNGEKYTLLELVVSRPGVNPERLSYANRTNVETRERTFPWRGFYESGHVDLKETSDWRTVVSENPELLKYVTVVGDK